jgi:hypothetical protein
MRKVLLILLFIPFLLFADNLILNPGFESWTGGQPDNWTTAGGAITLVQNTANVHGGSSSCEVTFTSTSNQDLISNSFSVTEGQPISLSVWIYDNDASGRARLSVLYTGASNYYGGYSSDQASWQELTYSGSVPAGATSAQFQVRFYDVGSPFTQATILVDDAVYDMTPVSGLAISNVSREYTVPTAAQSCYVQCDITGGTTPYTALIKYSVDGVAQSDIAMSNTGGDTYQGTIPAQSDGARVEYYIDVTDAAPTNVTSSTYSLFWGTTDISATHSVDGNGVLMYDGYYARLTGVATVAGGVFSTSNLDVYIQDATGGINLFKGGAGASGVVQGNSYTVVGAISQFNGKAEIIPDDAGTDITDNGASTMPDPQIKTIAQLLAAAETYEGMLVGVQHLEKTSGTWGSNAALQMHETGLADVLTLFIDGDTDLDENSEPTWPKDVVGIFTQYDNSSPYTDGYELVPRAYSDISGDGSLPVELTSFSATAGDAKITLKWVTESEIDNVGFEIWRSMEEEGEYTSLASYTNNDDLKGQFNSNTRHSYRFTDKLVANDFTYWYKLVDVDLNGKKTFHGPLSATPHANGTEIVNNGNLPEKFALHPNFPNPFNPKTSLSFDIPRLKSRTTEVSLVIYNSLGQSVKSLYQGATGPGSYTIEWDGTNDSGNQLASGIYYAVLHTTDFTRTLKMIMMK